MDLWLTAYAFCFLFAIPKIKWHRRSDPLFEYWNTGDTASYTLYGVNWRAQTFTVGSTPHTVTSVKVYVFRTGSPSGNFILSIRATDASGHPTGSDLTSGSILASTLATVKTWTEITVTSYLLSASTKYAIVCRAPNGDSSNYVTWRATTTGGYAGGNLETSTNSGSSWSAGTADLQFEVWGEYPTNPPTNCTVSIISETSLRVSWTDASTDEDDFHIERKQDSGSYSEVHIMASTTKTGTGTVYEWDNSSLLMKVLYTYRVRAHNHTLSLYSGYSNEASETTPFYAPSSLVVITLSFDQLKLTWVDNSQNESDYHIERKTGIGGTYGEITTVAAGTTEYTDTGLEIETSYYYKIRAHNHAQSIYSDYCTEAGAQTALYFQIRFNPYTSLVRLY